MNGFIEVVKEGRRQLIRVMDIARVVESQDGKTADIFMDGRGGDMIMVDTPYDEVRSQIEEARKSKLLT